MAIKNFRVVSFAAFISILALPSFGFAGDLVEKGYFSCSAHGNKASFEGFQAYIEKSPLYVAALTEGLNLAVRREAQMGVEERIGHALMKLPNGEELVIRARVVVDLTPKPIASRVDITVRLQRITKDKKVAVLAAVTGHKHAEYSDLDLLNSEIITHLINQGLMKKDESNWVYGEGRSVEQLVKKGVINPNTYLHISCTAHVEE